MVSDGIGTTCPDDGACHHSCETRCFRVSTCEPLSAAGWGANWPQRIVRADERARLAAELRDEARAMEDYIRDGGHPTSAVNARSARGAATFITRCDQ